MIVHVADTRALKSMEDLIAAFEVCGIVSRFKVLQKYG